MSRPWVGRVLVGAAVIVVGLGVLIRSSRHPGASSTGGAGTTRDSSPGPGSALPPQKSPVNDFWAESVDPLAVQLASESDSSEHMTPEEALAVNRPHEYPTYPCGVVFTPTARLRESLGRVDSASRQAYVGTFENFRTKCSASIRDAGLREPADRFAQLLSQNKSIEEVHLDVLAKYGVGGKQTVDVFFDERLKQYQGLVRKFQAAGDAQKVKEYIIRIEFLLSVQIEMDRSTKYR